VPHVVHIQSPREASRRICPTHAPYSRMALKRAACDGMVDAFVPKAVSRLHFQYAPRNFILDNTASRASCHNASSVCFIDSPTCGLCVCLKACAHHRNQSLTCDARNKFQNNSNNHCDKCQRRTILFTTRALAHLPTLVTRWRITTAHLMLVTMRRRSKLRLDWCRCLHCQIQSDKYRGICASFH